MEQAPSKYVRDFEALFVPIKKTELRDKARNGQLRDSLFRSVCWRYFLHCLPEQYDQWLDNCHESRLRYEQIRAKHLSTSASHRTSADKTIQVDNNDDSKEPDEAQQCDHNNVFRTIERDVVRTFPDMEFFRQTEMQNILENVLYNYASENPQLSYHK